MARIRLLLLGDLHLSTTGSPVPLECPDLDLIDVDGIISIGDIIDDNKDHAQDTSTGTTYEDRCRAFFRQLNDVGVPVVAVPGNHDPIACTRRPTDGLGNVVVAHRCVVDESTLESSILDELCFVGWGCEQFDLTPAFRYGHYSGIVPEQPESEAIDQIARESAETVEAVVSQFPAGELDRATAATELGVDLGRQETCANELEALSKKFETIRSLLAKADKTTILLSHESPFHFAFDYHHSADGIRQRLHRGSIPLKMAIAATGPYIVFSGHMHTKGRDVIETTDGYSDLYNPGSPNVAIIDIDTDTGRLRNDDVDN